MVQQRAEHEILQTPLFWLNKPFFHLSGVDKIQKCCCSLAYGQCGFQERERSIFGSVKCRALIGTWCAHSSHSPLGGNVYDMPLRGTPLIVARPSNDIAGCHDVTHPHVCHARHPHCSAEARHTQVLTCSLPCVLCPPPLLLRSNLKMASSEIVQAGSASLKMDSRYAFMATASATAASSGAADAAWDD